MRGDQHTRTRTHTRTHTHAHMRTHTHTHTRRHTHTRTQNSLDENPRPWTPDHSLDENPRPWTPDPGPTYLQGYGDQQQGCRRELHPIPAPLAASQVAPQAHGCQLVALDEEVEAGEHHDEQLHDDADDTSRAAQVVQEGGVHLEGGGRGKGRVLVGAAQVVIPRWVWNSWVPACSTTHGCKHIIKCSTNVQCMGATCSTLQYNTWVH